MGLFLPALAMGGASLLSNWLGGKSEAEAQAANIEAMNQRFAEMQKMLSPYTQAGTQALGQQQALMGLAGPDAQAAAISAIEEGPGFTEAVRQGEEAMLQRASATGGLRGGNIQGALAQFRPQMLNQAIQQRYSQLGGLAGQGLGAASTLGGAGINIAGMTQQTAQPDFFQSLLGGLGTGLGTYAGLGGEF